MDRQIATTAIRGRDQITLLLLGQEYRRAAACEELPSEGPEGGLTEYLLQHPNPTLEQVLRILEGEPGPNASDNKKEE